MQSEEDKKLQYEETQKEDDLISTEFQKIITAKLESIQAGLESVGTAIAAKMESFYANIASIGEVLTQAINRIEENTRMTVSNLAEKGWYCDLGKTQTEYFEFMSKIVTEDDDISEENIIKYYKENLDPIKTNLIALYPHREKFIEKGFQSHHDLDFISSIPLFLMFTDGISYEKIEVSLFSSRDKQLRIKKEYVKDLDINELQKATLLAITEYWAINGREDGMNDSEINRNRILHGKSLDYDTEINSLKMISFANYVAGVFNSWPTASKPHRVLTRSVINPS